ncbi:MAG: type IV pilus assembly protein PilN [Gammaproteobacteria bacterium]|jgi:type IV pilus assembly protein PilN
MAHINLLPWREERRQQRQKNLITALVVASLVAASIVGAAWYSVNQAMTFQQNRNQFLQAETRLLDRKIKEIKDLEKVKNKLLSRMDVIESLQDSRKQPVHFFNELTTTLPEGVYVLSVNQKGNAVTVSGRAQSNARVSEYMRNIVDSGWFSEPRLVVITAKTSGNGNVRSSQFTLKFKINRIAVMPGETVDEGEES